MPRATRRSRAVAAIAAFGLFTQTAAPIGLATTQAGAKPAPAAAPATQATAATTKPAAAGPPIVDGGWPRIYDLPSGGTILVYQPQVASWEKQKHLVAYSAVSQRAKAGDKPAIGTIKLEADTSVSTVERLVSFQRMKIVEANFQTLNKDQVREITDRDRQGDSRRRTHHRSRPRARQSGQKSGHPQERRGREGGSADDLLQHVAGRDHEPRWRADLESDQGERSEVRGQYELGSVPVPADQHLLPSQQRHLAQGHGREGDVVARGQAASQLREAAGGRELEGRQGEPARQAGRRFGSAEGLRQPAAGGAHSPDRRARVSARGGHRAAVGQQHRERRVPDGQDRSGVLPRRGPLVLGARLHRAVDVCHADLAGRLQEDSARAPALARAGLCSRNRPGG